MDLECPLEALAKATGLASTELPPVTTVSEASTTLDPTTTVVAVSIST